MNYIKIKYFLILSCTTLNIVFTNEKKQDFMLNFFTPLEVEISLDFLKTEIDNYKDELKNDWDSPSSQNIIKKAEHIAQSAPTNFQDNVTQKIIKLFDAIDIKVSFDPIHLTIINDETDAKNHFDDLSDPISLIQQKEDQLKRIKEQEILNEQKAKKNKKTIIPIKIKPKKIKGARRSMNKLRKYHEDQRKKELARHNELLEYFNSRRKQAQEKEKQEEKEKQAKDLKINQEKIEKDLFNKPSNTTIIQRKNIQSAHKPTPKNILISKKIVHQEHLHPHELFTDPANLN